MVSSDPEPSGLAGEEGAEVKAEPRPHEEEQQNGRGEARQLGKKQVVAGEVDIHHAHGHAPQQRGNFQHIAEPAEGKENAQGQDQTVVSGTGGGEQPFEQQSAYAAQYQHAQGSADGTSRSPTGSEERPVRLCRAKAMAALYASRLTTSSRATTCSRVSTSSP